jgi:diadenosine tetraphosphate (Ap4A) HIT family hydrolase
MRTRLSTPLRREELSRKERKEPQVENYERFLIREYDNWKVYLHESQYYLGRIYLWAKRESALDFFEMTKEERGEYFDVGIEQKKVLRRLFLPDLFNYATLANIAPHLHTHIIPRYSGERYVKGVKVLEGVRFLDERWGQNYAPYNKDFKLTEDQLQAVRNLIRRAQ